MAYISRQLSGLQHSVARSHRRALTGAAAGHEVTLKHVKYRDARAIVHIAKNARALAARRPALSTVAIATREREENLKKERVRTPPVVKMHQSPAPPPRTPGSGAPSRFCRTARVPLAAVGILRASRKLSCVVTFALAAAGILRAFAYDRNCSRRMMYGFVARRVRSSYYGRLNEQFLSTFILSGIARIFPRENTSRVYVQSVHWMKVKSCGITAKTSCILPWQRCAVVPPGNVTRKHTLNESPNKFIISN